MFASLFEYRRVIIVTDISIVWKKVMIFIELSISYDKHPVGTEILLKSLAFLFLFVDVV